MTDFHTLIDSYQNKPDITWSTLSSCYAEEGQLAFEVMYGDSGFCGSEFYLDTARSTDNDYYFEGAFAISSDYRQGEPLRLEALEPGKTTVRADGAGTAKTVLAVDLPVFLVVHFREHVVFILNLYAKLCKDEVPRFFIGYELVDGE